MQPRTETQNVPNCLDHPFPKKRHSVLPLEVTPFHKYMYCRHFDFVVISYNVVLYFYSGTSISSTEVQPSTSYIITLLKLEKNYFKNISINQNPQGLKV